MSAIHLAPGTKRGSYSRKAARFLTRKGEEQSVIQSNASVRKQLTPRQVIREHYIDCIGSASNIKDCRGDELYNRPCIFFPYRVGAGRPSVKLIWKFFLYCMGGNQKLVRECRSKICPFLPYCTGENPGQQGRRGRFKSVKRPPHEAISRQESTIGVAPIPYSLSLQIWRVLT